MNVSEIRIRGSDEEAFLMIEIIDVSCIKQ